MWQSLGQQPSASVIPYAVTVNMPVNWRVEGTCGGTNIQTAILKAQSIGPKQPSRHAPHRFSTDQKRLSPKYTQQQKQKKRENLFLLR